MPVWGKLYFIPASPIDGNRWSVSQSINRYQSIKLANWYRLVWANRWAIDSHILNWLIDCHRLAKQIASSYSRSSLTRRISAAWYAHSNLIPLVMADTHRKSESQDIELSIVKGYHHCGFEVNTGELFSFKTSSQSLNSQFIIASTRWIYLLWLDNVSGRWIQNGVTVQGKRKKFTVVCSRSTQKF